MYNTSTHCKYCKEDFVVKNEDKDLGQELLMNMYSKHIRSDEHKNCVEQHRLNQYITIKCHSKCQCGELIEVETSEIRAGSVTEAFKQDVEGGLMNELREHKRTVQCKTIINRDDKIKQVLKK